MFSLKRISSVFIILFSWLSVSAQYVQVDVTTYNPQELIEDVLINSGCISNVQVTEVIGGNFSDGSKSYGYFNDGGSTFPLSSGIVMSTGKVSNVPGPNASLSDDNAPAWEGDSDLENALGISNTTNATILEFDFTPNANTIRFRYLFASEEYQEGDPNTCIYSDAFAFLIKPIGGQYTNIALVPGTSTPVLVTTVHSGIPGGCPPINETYFEGWNSSNAAINFNGQTKVLTAQSEVIPNTTYHIKLVIADEQNHRYDSAVFLEAESFTIGADLGPDRSFTTNNPLCDDETYELDATPDGTMPQGYSWFKNGMLLPLETTAQLTVSTPGTYKVEIDYGAGCVASDEVLIEYASEVIAINTDLHQCDDDDDGIATFNLYDASEAITNNDNALQIQGFYNSASEAETALNEIVTPNSYTNSVVNEIVFARVETPLGCYNIAEVTLRTTMNSVGPYELATCSFVDDTAFGTFDLSEVSNEITTTIGPDSNIAYYERYEDALDETDPLPLLFTNTLETFQTIYVRVSNATGCIGIGEVYLTVVPTPVLEELPNTYYCIDTFPSTISLSSGLLGDPSDYSFLWSTGATSPTIAINEPGTYAVTVTYTQYINSGTYSCEASQTITVLASEAPQLSYEVNGNYGNQTIVVTAAGVGDYEYAINDPTGYYQDEPVFTNVLGGVYTIYARDKNGCGLASIQAYVLDFPRFFTPNQDGFHDRWQVAGQEKDAIQVYRIEIFDRYNRVLYVMTPESPGWDGSWNGNPLPSSDYWFVAYFSDGGTYRNHFTMKR